MLVLRTTHVTQSELERQSQLANHHSFKPELVHSDNLLKRLAKK
jgi:hypothetical protein